MPNLSYAKKWAIASENMEKMGIYDEIVEYAGISEGNTINVLDLGCGYGNLLHKIFQIVGKGSMLIGIDYNEDMLMTTRNRFEEVNYHYRPLVLETGIIELGNKFEFAERKGFPYNHNIELKKGVNLIGDLYDRSVYPYLAGHELDKIFLTFIGGGVHYTSRFDSMIEDLVHNLKVYMRDGAELIVVDKILDIDRVLHMNGTKLCHAIIEETGVLELQDKKFVEYPEKFVAAIYPLGLNIRMDMLDGSGKGTNFDVEFDNKSFEETVEHFKGLEKDVAKLGIHFSKFRKV